MDIFLAAPVIPERITEPFIQETLPIFLTLVSLILIAPLLSEFARLPGIVGLILAGVLIGPSVLNILAVDETIVLFSTVGLIYLMFTAGLEIDLIMFNRVRNRALVLALIAFVLAQISGQILGYFYGLSFVGSILLGADYASQTLVALPVIMRLGIARSEVVATAIGATIINELLALLILAAVTSGDDPNHPELGPAARLVILAVIYIILLLIALPRIGKAFLSRFSGRSVEFQFVLVAIFVAAFLAEAIGLEAIVGAFLAGLAVNSLLPHRSPILGRVVFFGEAFFIPFFMMYIGMITDPVAIFTDVKTLSIGISLVITVYIVKFLASYLAGRLFQYRQEETFITFGMLHAEAAVALAILQVGQGVGLFGEEIFNGAILMVLVTCFTSPLVVQYWGRRLNLTQGRQQPSKEKLPLFSRVLIPVSNPASEDHLVNLAAILAKTANGTLLPMNVARYADGHAEGLALQEQLLDADTLHDPDLSVEPVARVDTSIAGGILRTAIEKKATLIIMGWHGQPTLQDTIFGSVLDEVLWETRIPALISRINSSINLKQRVILVIPPNSIASDAVQLTVETAIIIAQAVNASLLLLVDEFYRRDVEKYFQGGVEVGYQIRELDLEVVGSVVNIANGRDLILVTTMGSRARFQSSLGTIPEEIAQKTTASLVVVRYPM
ncbi:MAG: cation:proton antiporter [Anaerolineae bacterium]|nr:cation:proton antiporter [Anaerolineae bacterium]